MVEHIANAFIIFMLLSFNFNTLCFNFSNYWLQFNFFNSNIFNTIIYNTIKLYYRQRSNIHVSVCRRQRWINLLLTKIRSLKSNTKSCSYLWSQHGPWIDNLWIATPFPATISPHSYAFNANGLSLESSIYQQCVTVKF